VTAESLTPAESAFRATRAYTNAGNRRRPPEQLRGLTDAQRGRAAVVAAALAERDKLAGQLANVEAFLRRENAL